MTPKGKTWPVFLIFGILVLAGCASGFLISLPGWNIERIEIAGSDYIPPEAISDLVGSSRGQNIWFLRRASLARSVRQLTPVKKVWFGFAWPATLVVKIEEKTPYLRLEQISGLAVVDDQAQLIAQITPDAATAGGESGHSDFAPRPEFLSLPLVKGLPQLVEGQSLPVETWSKLREIISAWKKYFSSYPLGIQVSQEDQYQLILADTLPVKLGSDHLGQKLEDLPAILGSAAVPLEKFAYLDLRFPENYVVKYRADGSQQQEESSGR